MVSERKRKVKELESPYMKQHEIMTHEKARRKKGLVRRLTVLGIITIALSMFALMTIHAQVSVLAEKEEKRESLEQQLKMLEDEQISLQLEIEQYHDLEFIAEIARRDYFLSKPGETIFKLPQSSTD